MRRTRLKYIKEGEYFKYSHNEIIIKIVKFCPSLVKYQIAYSENDASNKIHHFSKFSWIFSKDSLVERVSEEKVNLLKIIS